MTIKKITTLFVVISFVFTGCGEDSKRKEQEETERLEQRKTKREAELEEEEKQKTMEANSLAAQAMDEQSLSEFIAALQHADLAETFTKEEGPFTIFAPTDEAFGKMEKHSLDSLKDDDNKENLRALLEYHVVQDEISYQDLSERIKERNGEYSITTMRGAELTALMSGEDIVLKDQSGNTVTFVSRGIEASNGMLHLIDGVLELEHN